MSERPPASTLVYHLFFSRIALIAFPLDLRYKDDCKYIRDDFGQRRSALRGSSTPPTLDAVLSLVSWLLTIYFYVSLTQFVTYIQRCISAHI